MTGFTLSEQVLTVETALRIMGLDRKFRPARRFFAVTRSRSENNPLQPRLTAALAAATPASPHAG